MQHEIKYGVAVRTCCWFNFNGEEIIADNPIFEGYDVDFFFFDPIPTLLESSRREDFQLEWKCVVANNQF